LSIQELPHDALAAGDVAVHLDEAAADDDKPSRKHVRANSIE
jgi:hypothetical protein